MTRTADLHIHTDYSDSTDSPEEVVQQALECGLNCIAITDHDTIDGIMPTFKAAENSDLEVIVGIELSTEINTKDVHVLGYLFDCSNEKLTTQLKSFQEVRIDRVRLMLEKLAEVGIDNITVEEVCARTKSNAVGRPHLATLLKEKGWVSDIREAFKKYLGQGCCAYVPKYKQSPYEAIELIRQAGGVAVLAHPMITNKDEFIPKLVEAGLTGIEVYYPNCPINIIHYYEGVARKYGLVMTGGSDAHGRAKSNTRVGKVSIPYDFVTQLKERSA